MFKIISKIKKKIYDIEFIKQNVIELTNMRNNEINKLQNINEQQLKQLDSILKINEEQLNKINKINNNFNYSNLELLYLNCNIKTDKIKLLIIGFYGAPNLGDELMLETLLDKFLLNDNIDVTIMLCENYNFDITKYPGVKILHYPIKVLDLNILAEHFDCFIFGGGALIDDYDYDYNFYQLSLGNTLINLGLRALAFNKKVIYYGLSTTDKFKNKEYLNRLNNIVENSTYFSLRDTNSLITLKNNGISTKNIKIVNDIVLCNEKIYSTNNKTNRDRIISLFYICNDNTYNDVLDFSKDIFKKTKDKGYTLNFVPYYSYNDNDSKFYEKLVKDLKYERTSIAAAPTNFNELVDILEKSDLVISMRYHISLISNILNIKTMSILYTDNNQYPNKMKYMYNNYGFDNNLYNMKEKNNISSKVISILNADSIKKDYRKILKTSNEELKYVIDIITDKEK